MISLHRHAGRESAIGVLEDDLHIGAQAAEPALGQVGDVLPLEHDPA